MISKSAEGDSIWLAVDLGRPKTEFGGQMQVRLGPGKVQIGTWSINTRHMEQFNPEEHEIIVGYSSEQDPDSIEEGWTFLRDLPTTEDPPAEGERFFTLEIPPGIRARWWGVTVVDKELLELQYALFGITRIETRLRGIGII